MLNALTKLSDWLNKTCQFLLVICISVLIIVMALQIFTRAFLGFAFSWADGTARYMLIWTTFLGATIAAKESSHITLTFIIDRFHGKARIIADCIVILLFMFLAGVVTYAGFHAVELVLPQKSDSLPISIAWIYASIPFCQLIIFYHLLVNLLTKLRQFFRPGPLALDEKGGDS